ncbi:hypothetical protein [Klebsiella pneumoniae]
MAQITDERLVKILSETQATIMEHNSRCVRGSVEVDARLFESMIMELQVRRKIDEPPVHPTVASETLDDETLQELIEFRRTTFEYHSKEGNKVQTIIHGVTLSALRELQERRKAAMDSEPVAWRRFQETPTDGGYWVLCGDKPNCSGVEPLYRHAQPAAVELANIALPHSWLDGEGVEVMSANEVKRACRAAMLERQLVDHVDEELLITIKSAPALGSLPKTGEVQNTNSPVVPDGYVMVPKEPTEAMMLHNSGCQHHAWDDPDCAMRQTRRLIWSHMLAAAPQETNS